MATVTALLEVIDRTRFGPIRDLTDETARVKISAIANKQSALVSCDYSGITYKRKHIDIVWTPKQPGVSLLTCAAGGHMERRLVRVIPGRRAE